MMAGGAGRPGRRSGLNRVMRLGCTLGFGLGLVAGLGVPVPALAQQAETGPFVSTPPPELLTGNWGGLRDELSDRGVSLDLRYKIQPAINVSGGRPDEITAPGEVRAGTTLDLDKVLGWRGGTLRVSVTRRHGGSLEKRAGLELLMQPQEVFGTGAVLRLSEVTLQQSLADGRLVLKVGRMSPSEFATFDCGFMNLGLCGAPPGNTVTRYWYVPPAVSWHGWTKLRLGAAYLKTGVTEDNWNNADPGFFLSRRGAKGVLSHLEFGWTPAFGGGALVGRYQVGGWINSAADDDVLLGRDGRPRAAGAPALRHRGQYGWYMQGQQQVTGRATEDPITGQMTRQRGLNLFFNYLLNDRRTEVIVTQANAGLFVNAPFAVRPRDSIGLGVVRTRYNPRAADAEMIAAPSAERRGVEIGIEANYSWRSQAGVMIRPTAQYIVHPGGRRSAGAPVIVGAAIELNF